MVERSNFPKTENEMRDNSKVRPGIGRAISTRRGHTTAEQPRCHFIWWIGAGGQFLPCCSNSRVHTGGVIDNCCNSFNDKFLLWHVQVRCDMMTCMLWLEINDVNLVIRRTKWNAYFTMNVFLRIASLVYLFFLREIWTV